MERVDARKSCHPKIFVADDASPKALIVAIRYDKSAEYKEKLNSYISLGKKVNIKNGTYHLAVREKYHEGEY